MNYVARLKTAYSTKHTVYEGGIFQNEKTRIYY